MTFGKILFFIDVVVIAVIVVVDVDVDVGCSGFCAPKTQNQRARSPTPGEGVRKSYLNGFHFSSPSFGTHTNSVPPSYIYGTPYLGSAGGSTGAGTASGLVPIPATQLSHAAAIAAATSQFYEYQVWNN